jgi:hypothetical protein|tara:strand:+ start:326 stop:508 length:183 start_codon:yes stop_codon:yes gene_type:complete
MEVELGYQYLDTRFTGTSSTKLSGSGNFPFPNQDMGVANLLADAELQSYFTVALCLPIFY